MTLQERILALGEKIKDPPNWWWKVLGGILIVLAVLWIRYLLSKRSDELAAAKTELAANKLNAQQALVTASLEKDNDKRKLAEAAVRDALVKVDVDTAALAKLEEEHKLDVQRVQAISDRDWDALNKLAGVK